MYVHVLTLFPQFRLSVMMIIVFTNQTYFLRLKVTYQISDRSDFSGDEGSWDGAEWNDDSEEDSTRL